MTSNWGSNTNSNKTLPPNIQNFLETLRSRSNQSSTKDSDGIRSPFAEIEQKRQLESKRISQFHQARQQEWQHVYSAKERAIQKQIESIREQLKKLATELSQKTQNIDRQIIAVVNQPTINAGEYELSFLDHVKNILELVRQDVVDANNWLKSYKGRCQKKGYYWQQTAKQGSSFFLNNERSVATSVG